TPSAGAGRERGTAPSRRQGARALAPRRITMDPTTQQWRFQLGDEVYGADDSKLGKVIAVLPDATRPAHLLVEKGLLFHTDYYVPVDAVAHYDAGRVYLAVTKAEALHRGWD